MTMQPRLMTSLGTNHSVVYRDAEQLTLELDFEHVTPGNKKVNEELDQKFCIIGFVVKWIRIWLFQKISTPCMGVTEFGTQKFQNIQEKQ